MKEHPILFSGPMVRAILEGRKTQTRRVVKNPYTLGIHQGDHAPLVSVCPYGKTGDRLWVRETWARKHETADCAWYAADFEDYRAAGKSMGVKWKPSIHMPHRVSRLTLEITDVRVERVQDISWIDAVAEGMHDPRRAELRTNPTTGCVARFRGLWDEINSERGYGWENNPWVWVVEFRQVQR